jgi:hypothetical protein
MYWKLTNVINSSYHKSNRTNKYVDSDTACLFSCYTNHEAGATDYSDPELASTSNSDPDTLKHHKSIVQSDCDEFANTASLEMYTLKKMNTWKEIPKADVPNHNKILGGTWVFKCIQDRSGKILKHKCLVANHVNIHHL